MIKPSVRFSFLLALALVSFLFQGTVTTSASLSSSSNTAEPAVSKPFKPVLMSSLARKVDENTQRIALLDNDLDSLLTINFIVSRDLLAEIVPYNEEEVIFVLSGTPSLSTLSKLIFVLNANINRLDMISTVIRQYSHYDQISERMFQNAIEAFTTLGSLHNSIRMLGFPDIYENVLLVIAQVSNSLTRFVQTFSSSLLIDRIDESKILKTIVLQNVSGIFYIIHNVLQHDFMADLVDLMFSAVGTLEEEQFVWNIWKQVATSSHCVSLPIQYLTSNHTHEIPKTLAADLIVIFSTTETFDVTWLDHLGALIRFRILSETEILEIFTKIALLSETAVDSDCFLNFIRLVFFNETAQPNCPKEALNHLSKPIEQFSRHFYQSLWSTYINDNRNVSTVDEDLLNTGNYIGSVLYHLEQKFPGITGNFQNVDESAQLDSLRLVDFLEKLQVVLDTEDQIESLILFINYDLKAEFKKFTIQNIRFRLNILFSKFLNILEAIENSQIEDPFQLKLLIQVVEEFFRFFPVHLKFLPEIREKRDMELLIDFAFKLEKVYQAEDILEFLLLKLDLENPILFETYFHRISVNLAFRPQFFALKIDRETFTKLPLPVLSSFLETIKETVEISQEFITFLGIAYLNDAVSLELLFFYLDKLANSDEFNFSSDLTSFAAFFSSITDVSFLEYERDDSNEYFLDMFKNSRSISIKSFHVLTALLQNPSIDPQAKLTIEANMIPWICARLTTFEDIKPEIKQENQFNDMNLTLPMNCEESSHFATQIIEKLLVNGASIEDLHRIFEFIRVTERFTMEAAASSSKINYTFFTLIVFILRVDDSIIPISYISKAMGFLKFIPLRVCTAQIIYNSINSVSIRENLFNRLVHLTFVLLDHSFLLDTRIFDGFSEESVHTLLEPFMKETFFPFGIDRMRLEALGYWMSHGLVPLDQARMIISNTAVQKDRPVVLKLGIALLKAVFKCPKYNSLRNTAVNDLFLAPDHTLIAPKPTILGMISSLTNLFTEPEFVDAFDQFSTSFHIVDIKAIILSEVNRVERVNKDGALNLSEGIENVLETYNKALIKANSFELPLKEKVIIFKSICANLNRLNFQNGSIDYIDEEFALKLVDDFVRVSIYLAVQIFTDATGPTFAVELEKETIELFLGCLVQYVRDSNVQGILVHHLFHTAQTHHNAPQYLLETLPKYLNWRRFILLPDNFRLIFNFHGPVHRFDKFMNEIIEAAFRFEDFTAMDAVDLSSPSSQPQVVHASFFKAMASLIKQFNLPVKYTLKTLQLMNENFGAIEILSPHLIQFLRVAIKEPMVDVDSVCYRITKRSYGETAIFHDQPTVLHEILSFISKRPDFVDLALVNGRDSEPDLLMNELKRIAIDNIDELYNHPAIRLPRSFFDFPYDAVESLKLVNTIELPENVKRNLAHWFSFSKNTSNESTVQIALLALNLTPNSFELETFTDTQFSCYSWLPISVTFIEWISKLSSEFPRKFGREINQIMLHKFLNLLLWNLEYDGTEKLVSTAFLNVLDALTFANDQVMYNFIKLLGNPQFIPLTRILRSNYNTNISICSNFRLWVWTAGPNSNLGTEVEGLIMALLEDEITFHEDEIMSLRESFLADLVKVDSYEKIEDAERCLTEMIKNIQNLRLMHEIDLVLTFIKKLAEVTRRFYGLAPSDECEDFSTFLGITLHYLRSELLLQSDYTVFLDFFKFLFRHTSCEKTAIYFETVDLLFSQIRSNDLIQSTLIFIIDELRLDASLIPGKGFPKHFYENKATFTKFVHAYLWKLNKIGTMNAAPHNGVKGVAMDGIHFLMIFNVLHEMNAHDELFLDWFENISRIRDNDMCGDIFSHNLKVHCVKRPHLTDNLIIIYINDQFVEKAFISLVEPAKGNIMTAFKLMLKNNSKLFHERLARLSPHLKKLMNSSIVVPFLQMNRKLVQDLIEKCRLSELTPNAANIDHILPNLVLLLKMDITSVISTEKSSEFFSNLNRFTVSLLSSGHSTELDLNLMTIILALQAKNQSSLSFKPNPLLLDRVLRLQSHEQTEEISNLLLKQVFGTAHVLTFSSLHIPFLTKLIVKSNDPNQIIFDMFKHEKLSSFTVGIIQSILKTPGLQVELGAVVQAILPELISAKRVGSEFKLLILLAKIHNLLSKTQLLLLESPFRTTQLNK